GQVGQTLPDAAPLRAAREPSGPAHSPRALRTHLLEVIANVAGGRLQVQLTYGELVHERASVNALGERFLEALRGLIDHCLSPEAGGYTASDFQAGALGQHVVDRLATLSNLPQDEAHQSLASRKNIENVYPLSPMQEGMLFHTVYAHGDGVYVTQLDWAVRGSFDVPAFERAFQRVVDRHPILRTFFVWEGLDRPVQVVQKQATITLDLQDLRGLLPAEQAERMRRFSLEDRKRDFELSRAPLLRVTVFHLGDDLHRCLFSIHHILIDGWSMPILIKEVRSLYDAYVAGREITLDPLPSYSEFIAWLSKQDVSKTDSFFRQKLRGFSAPTPFGVDRVAPEGVEAGHDEQQIVLSSAISDEVVAFARREQLTLNTLVQGAFALLLSRYSGEEDVLFGATVSGRSAPVPGIERMVGIFINAVPVRVSVSRELPVNAWLSALQEQQIEIREHEHTPLVAVQGMSDVPRGTPLFESILVFENYPIEESMGPMIEKEPSNVLATEPRKRATSMGDARVQERSNYPLMLVAAITGRLSFRVSYDRRRFERGVIERMLAHLGTLIEGMIAAPTGQVGELPILPAAERQTLLTTWNDTQRDFPDQVGVQALIAAQAERTPDAKAVSDETTSLSYSALMERGRTLAGYLVSRGVGPGTLVGVALERSAEMLVTLLGILLSGAAYVPLDPAYPDDRLGFMIADSGLPMLITEAAIEDKMRAIVTAHGQAARTSILRVDADREAIEAAGRTPIKAPAGPLDLAYVIYTSGSTGRPKGVQISHRALCNFLTTMQDRPGIRAEDRLLAVTSLSFDIAGLELFLPLISGASVEVATAALASDGVALRDRLSRSGITLMQATPSTFRILLDAGWQGDPALKLLV
ncbi:MAG: condensation domain-containing protein, partial [Minicystis sp.]